MGHRHFTALALLLCGLSACDSLDPQVREALDHVRSQQKDPDATKFQNVQKCNNGFYITGDVLGKNSYGAYTGWKKFYASSVSFVVEGENDYETMQEEEKECAMSSREWDSYMDARNKEYEASTSSASSDPVGEDLN